MFSYAHFQINKEVCITQLSAWNIFSKKEGSRVGVERAYHPFPQAGAHHRWSG